MEGLRIMPDHAGVLIFSLSFPTHARICLHIFRMLLLYRAVRLSHNKKTVLSGKFILFGKYYLPTGRTSIKSEMHLKQASKHFWTIGSLHGVRDSHVFCSSSVCVKFWLAYFYCWYCTLNLPY